MNLLLDTHVALWAITDNPKLPAQGRSLIESPDNPVWISAATIWEIAIKHQVDPANMPVSGADAIGYFTGAGYGFLSISRDHAAAVESLPNHHRDPFDRILVAQALYEPMRLLTHDLTVARYSDTIIRI